MGQEDTIAATVDYWDDPVDVYKIVLEGHEQLRAQLTAAGAGASLSLELWRPGTVHVDRPSSQRLLAVKAGAPGTSQHLSFRAPGRGWYYLEVRSVSPDFTPYTLKFSKRATGSRAARRR